MKIFITGIAGFLGSNLANHFLKKKINVIGCDNLIGGEIRNVPKEAIYYNADCENLELMTKITKGADIVIHTAALAHEGLSNFSPKSIVSNNVVGSTSVFTAAIKNNVKRIVYCSSMARYGNIKIPFREEDEPFPIDPYGISKLAAEKILINLSKTHNFEYNIAVPHNIIGPNQKYDDPYRNVVSIMVNLMLQNKRPYIYGDGEQKRSFSDVEDCIYCLEQMALRKDVKSQVFNIGPDEEFTTINELYSLLSNKVKFNKSPIYVDDRPNEVKYSLCSSDKARKILNYKTTVLLNESVDKVVEFIKKNGTKKFDYELVDLEINNNLTPKTWKDRLF